VRPMMDPVATEAGATVSGDAGATSSGYRQPNTHGHHR
jgi:hypothetical protein